MELAMYLRQPGATQSSLASAVGVSSAVVWQWINNRRPVPIEHCAAIERATSGAVTRRDLRPDDWARIWPELADQKDEA